jgi:hypothetical protein
MGPAPHAQGAAVAQREHAIRTPDGRTLALREAGALEGPAVVVHHGTTGGPTAFPAHDADDARVRGVREGEDNLQELAAARAGRAQLEPLPATAQALAPGIEGWAEDDLAFPAP